MVAHEKSIWLGGMLAASLFVLVLAGCGASPSLVRPGRHNIPRRVHPPRQQRTMPLLQVGPPTASPTSLTRSDLSTSQAHLCERVSAAGMYSPGECWPPKSASRSPTPNRVLAGQP
jgi:hypothetical protein